MQASNSVPICVKECVCTYKHGHGAGVGHALVDHQHRDVELLRQTHELAQVLTQL